MAPAALAAVQMASRIVAAIAARLVVQIAAAIAIAAPTNSVQVERVVQRVLMRMRARQRATTHASPLPSIRPVRARTWSVMGKAPAFWHAEQWGFHAARVVDAVPGFAWGPNARPSSDQERPVRAMLSVPRGCASRAPAERCAATTGAFRGNNFATAQAIVGKWTGPHVPTQTRATWRPKTSACIGASRPVVESPTELPAV